MSYSASFDSPPLAPARRGMSYETLLSGVIFMMLSFSAMSIIEPSPYDFIAILAVPMWMIGGFRLHGSLMLIIFLWILYTLIGFIALTPYWHEPDPRLFQIQSLFLLITVAFFTIYFSERPETRLRIAMNGYVVAGIVAALVGLAGYVGIGDFGTMYEGRASGTFKDPNVLGSFLLLVITYLTAQLLLGLTKRPLFVTFWLVIAMVGQFLTFSRGAWMATVFAVALLGLMGFTRYADRRLRRRMVGIGSTILALAVMSIAIALTDEGTRELLFMRASAVQDYDVGETGRFGNQLRAIITLLGKPEGFGPLRLRLTFMLDPHNSYIGAFANFGWIGGFLWIIIVSTTFYVGFRTMWQRTPIQPYAIAIVPAVLAMLLQGFQIDIDHWRHVYIGFGAVWGMEAARARWAYLQSQEPTFGRTA